MLNNGLKVICLKESNFSPIMVPLLRWKQYTVVYHKVLFWVLYYYSYIPMICQLYKNTEPFLFADDSNLFISDKDPHNLESQLNKLENISVWLKINKLSLNIKKTHYMMFTRKRKISVDVSLSIDSNVITEVSSTKFLGVFLDNKLIWKKHIGYIVAKLSRGIGLISKARKLLNADALLTLYYYFLYPYLCHCNHVWGSTYITNLQKLIVLQKRLFGWFQDLDLEIIHILCLQICH